MLHHACMSAMACMSGAQQSGSICGKRMRLGWPSGLSSVCVLFMACSPLRSSCHYAKLSGIRHKKPHKRASLNILKYHRFLRMQALASPGNARPSRDRMLAKIRALVDIVHNGRTHYASTYGACPASLAHARSRRGPVRPRSHPRGRSKRACPAPSPRHHHFLGVQTNGCVSHLCAH